jgi:hypothetical protein
MTAADFTNRFNYFIDQLGIRQVKAAEAVKWGFNKPEDKLTKLKAFLYLNTLSRYSPSGSNYLTEAQAEFILTQLGKLLV